MNTLLLIWGLLAPSWLYADMVDTSAFSITADQRLNKLLETNDLEFRLPNQYGTGVSLSSFYNKKEIYLYSFLPSCQADQFMKKYKQMSGNKKSQAHLLINGEINAKREELETAYPKQPILIDMNQQVSNSLLFKKSGDYVVYNVKKQKVTKVGNVFGKKTLPASDCEIKYVSYLPDTNQFREKIVPALVRTCVYCHVGENNLSYFQNIEKIRSWKNMMLRTIRLNRMPPGADPYYSHLEFDLTTQDVLDVTKWLEAGAPATAEDGEFYLQEIQKNGKRKRGLEGLKGTEEVVLFPLIEEKVSATGGDFYKHYTTETPTTRDYYFTYFDISVNPNVAHHIALHHSMKPFPKVDLKGNPIGGENMALYGNNRIPTPASYNGKSIPAFKFQDPNIIHLSRVSGLGFAPRGTIYFIPKGSYLNFEIHYSPSGKEEVSQNILKIYTDENLKKNRLLKRFSMMPNDGALMARANESDSVVSVDYTLTEPMDLKAYGLHMHYRGKSGKVYALFPGETKRKLIFSIPTYQYKFQRTSFLDDVVHLPKGTVLTHEMHYDNSKENISNPDSTRDVHIGLSIVHDENYLPRFFYMDAIDEVSK